MGEEDKYIVMHEFKARNAGGGLCVFKKGEKFNAGPFSAAAIDSWLSSGVIKSLGPMPPPPPIEPPVDHPIGPVENENDQGEDNDDQG